MTLARVIKNNSTTTNLQANVFEFRTEITGRVVLDGNHNRQSDWGDPGLRGIIVQLRNGNGELLETTRTDSAGRYRFRQLDFGTYRVRILVPPGQPLVTQ